MTHLNACISCTGHIEVDLMHGTATLGVRSPCADLKFSSAFYTRYIFHVISDSPDLCPSLRALHSSLPVPPKLWNNYFQWWFIFVDILMGSVIAIAFCFEHEDDGTCICFCIILWCIERTVWCRTRLQLLLSWELRAECVHLADSDTATWKSRSSWIM